MGSVSRINESGSQLVYGEIVRVTTPVLGGVARAQADTPANVVGLLGVSGSGSAGVGGVVVVNTNGSNAEVLMEPGLTLAVGQTVFVSATVAGRGTIVTPSIAAPLGVIEDTTQYSRTGLVTVSLCLSCISACSIAAGVANWPIANTRWYSVDTVNGNDAYDGFSDVSCSDAGTKAKKTLAGLQAIFPTRGAGRKVVIALGAGTYNETLVFLAGCSGYASNFPLVVATGNVTNGATAFAGDVSDRTCVGAVTVTGLNANGYTPVGSPTAQTIQCVKNGGGAPGFPAEPASPLGWRVRFANNTATLALRNACAPIIGIPASDTFTLPNFTATGNQLPANPTTADVFYVEQAGVNVLASQIDCRNQASGTGTPAPQFVGIFFGAGTTRFNTAARLHFCGANTLTCKDDLEFPFTYIDETGATRAAGSGVAVDTFTTLSEAGPNYTAAQNATFVSRGACNFNNTARMGMGCGSVAGAGIFISGGSAPVGEDNSTCTIGGRTINTQSPLRILGPSGTALACLGFLGALITVLKVVCTGAGGDPAVRLQGFCVIFMNDGLSGVTGNNDVGLDLTLAYGSIIRLQRQPTVTGVAGDVRLSDGTIKTWASLMGTTTTDPAGNKIIG